jgi:hypothetical protein
LSEEKKDASQNSASNNTEVKNKSVKMTIAEAFAESDQLRKEKKDQADVIQDLTAKLQEMNEVLEGQEKAKLISEILPRSSFKTDELIGKSPEELKDILFTLNSAMPPKYNSVRFGVQAANLSDREKNLTVGDISWPTAQRRKAAS